MFHQPLTLDEARKYRYGDSSMNPGGNEYVETRCAAEVVDYTGWHCGQCQKKNGKGPHGLYCGIHAKKIIIKEEK